MIEVKNLTKRYGATIAVNNISFNAEAGEVVGLLGPNGAGKTTTMRILTCYMPADEGTATVAGHDIHENSVEVRKHIGYLPENAPLYTDMGVVDYLNFVAEVRAIPRSDRNNKVREMIETCGLEKVLRKDIGELSKGYRQRVGLAQALIHDPAILILDEPTAGLDPNQIIEIRQLIKKLGAEKTVILSTHILPEVEATCDRAVIINDGVIVASGTTDELASMGKGKETIYIQIRGPQEDIESRLAEMDQVAGFRKLNEPESGLHRYEVNSHGNTNITEALFHMVVDSDWSLAELRQVSASLEDVFRQLTTSDALAGKEERE
ncbi:ATP-binding cassette domain-containing protein [Candidatus Poribacteria bacterium]|nr:ATP-binding cassette domain-containing protein [Candidatus Poribacteria bacterium]